VGTKPERERLDSLLVARGLVENRTRAQALILAGKVRSRGERLDKPGHKLPVDIEIELQEGKRWVGRGAEKLAPVLEQLELTVSGATALDIGSSTGGFTQLLLELGAEHVFAIDVGKNQLDYRLRQDSRVTSMEGVNARYLDATMLPRLSDLAVADLSFISLEKVLPAVATCLRAGAAMVVLVKPQFEVGREQVGRGGIVRDRELHLQVLERIGRFALHQGWRVEAVKRAALCGADGNQEYFMHLKLEAEDTQEIDWESLLRPVTGLDGETE
jgi:23S rRNA (cytidine1920-2'-O)/16S rRNA (cytidine1409-2'-O)-methyltransferase